MSPKKMNKRSSSHDAQTEIATPLQRPISLYTRCVRLRRISRCSHRLGNRVVTGYMQMPIGDPVGLLGWSTCGVGGHPTIYAPYDAIRVWGGVTQKNSNCQIRVLGMREFRPADMVDKCQRYFETKYDQTWFEHGKLKFDSNQASLRPVRNADKEFGLL